jgi:hypothetical protein
MAGDTIPTRGRDPQFVTKVEDRLSELIASGFDGVRQRLVTGRTPRLHKFDVAPSTSPAD